MHRRTKLIGVVAALAAIGIFVTWSFWKSLKVEANAALQERTRALVEQNPQLKPAWEKALQDKVLTKAEAEAIVVQAGEKIAPE